MQAALGWSLALVAHVVGWVQYGWAGVALAFSVTVFWLLLEFSRTLRTLRRASAAPVGHVSSAVMLHSRLKPGLRLQALIGLAGSLGQPLRPDGEPTPPAGEDNGWDYAWRDAGGAEVRVRMARGRCVAWALERPPQG